MFRKTTIAVIGGGFSGVSTVVNILRKNPRDSLHLRVIEREKPLARGLAYRCWDDNLLLNVPAGNMSALADEPNHFVAYCQEIDPAFNSKSFISRRLYGDYLESTLHEAEKIAPGILERHTGEVLALYFNPGSKTFKLALQDGSILEAQKVVLALGHFLPSMPSIIPVHLQHQVLNPWDFHAIDRLDQSGPVALMGMGHTAIDVLFKLTSHNPSRKVFLFSRRGLLPHGHRFNPTPPVSNTYPNYLAGRPSTLRAYTHALRLEIAHREASGGNWRDVINELRPYTPLLWQNLPEAEQRRFLEKMVPYWDIHRHRLAPSAAHRLEKLLASGQVEKIAGTLVGIDGKDNKLDIQLKIRNTNLIRNLEVNSLINCTGPNYDLTKVKSPLVKQLFNTGLIKQDNLKLGIKLDENYQVINTSNQPIPGLYYIGPMLKSKYWEAIAVPELRNHALRLAYQLLQAENG